MSRSDEPGKEPSKKKPVKPVKARGLKPKGKKISINKTQAFWIGNVIGLTVLVGVIAFTNQKREVESIALQKAQEQKEANTMAPVVIAKRDIQAKQAINAADLSTKQVKFGTMAFGTITSVKDISGQHALKAIKKGTVITSSLLSD